MKDLVDISIIGLMKSTDNCMHMQYLCIMIEVYCEAYFLSISNVVTCNMFRNDIIVQLLLTYHLHVPAFSKQISQLNNIYDVKKCFYYSN